MIDSEIEDAKALIAYYGGDPTVFEFMVKADWDMGIELFPRRHKVTVMFDGHRPQYRVGDALNWLTQLDEDIRMGAFGPNFRKRALLG